MNTISQQARTLKKPNKNDVLNILKRLSFDYEDRQEDHDNLFLYFTHKIKRPKTVWDWVATAAATEESSLWSNLRNICVTKEHIIATDGQRLHCALNTNNIEPGFYCSDTGSKLSSLDSEDSFPDVLKFLNEIIYDTINQQSVQSIDTIQNGSELNYRFQPSGPLVSAAYYDAALAHPAYKSNGIHARFGPSCVWLNFDSGEQVIIMAIQEF